MARSISRRTLADYVAIELHSGANSKQLAQRLVAYLLETKQLGQIDLLVRDVEVAMAQKYGIVSTRVTSARPLTDDMRQALLTFVQATENAREAVLSDEHIDKDIIGGVIVETPSGVFDSSIRTMLRQLQATTKE